MASSSLSSAGVRPSELEQARILIIEDDEHVVHLLTNVLNQAGFKQIEAVADADLVTETSSVRDADLVVLDLGLPRRDGMEILQGLRSAPGDVGYVPVLVVTAEMSLQAKRRAFEAGATDFLTKPFHVLEFLLRARNLLTLSLLHRAMRHRNVSLESQVQQRTQHLWETLRRLMDQEEQTRRASEEMIRRLAVAAEYRDERVGRHVDRMSRYAELLARRIGWDEHRASMVRRAASMHDIGKLGVADRVLRKRGGLSAEQMEEMRRHTTIGYEILSGSDVEVVQMAARVALSHHERYDGSGYPEGAVGAAIPVEARIAAIADVFDALTSDRPHRRAMPLGHVLALMRESSGKHFDPGLLEVFLDSISEVLAIRDAYPEESFRARRR